MFAHLPWKRVSVANVKCLPLKGQTGIFLQGKSYVRIKVRTYVYVLNAYACTRCVCPSGANRDFPSGKIRIPLEGNPAYVRGAARVWRARCVRVTCAHYAWGCAGMCAGVTCAMYACYAGVTCGCAGWRSWRWHRMKKFVWKPNLVPTLVAKVDTFEMLVAKVFSRWMRLGFVNFVA